TVLARIPGSRSAWAVGGTDPAGAAPHADRGCIRRQRADFQKSTGRRRDMTEPAIQIEQLVKTYGSQKVLRNVSLSIPAGQTWALLGRNGAGKTTMIRILLGVLPADSGICRLGGVDPAVAPLKVRRNVGYLAEDQTMYGWMTSVELWRF